ncbi:alpha-galactosidase [Streptosporangium sp. CA-135522]|uniref:alpha-galactosidase n=1 Tax=Streptosporangium sp. CA-135522 TaxID=3240072 RepID=UPI003D94E985
MIEFDPTHRIWLLSTPASAYALRLDEDDTLCHAHWGRPLTLEQAAAVPRFRNPAESTFEHPREGEAELPVSGFGPSALQIRFPGGAREIEWRYDGHVVDGGHLTIHLHDRHYPLAAELHYRVREDSDVLERWTVLRHTGTDAPMELLRADSASWSVPRLPDYRLSQVTGAWSSEFRLRREPVPGGETVLTSRRGVSGHHANPWIMIDDGGAGEHHGEVWSTALAWSGSWRVTVHRSSAERLCWTGGFGHEGVTWWLGPGESLETPVFAGLYSAGGFGGTSRAWHAYITRHVLPAGSELRPVIYNSWEATGWAVTEEGQKRLAALAAEVGAELFVMDDGWFGARDSDGAGLGDWAPNPGKFPAGLDPLIAEVRRLGMRFGIWVEPEMVNPDSDLYRAHPDWVLHQPDRHRTLLRNQLVLDFGRPEVAAWAHGWLDRLVDGHEIDFLKWDMNRAFTEAGRPGSGDPGRVWIDHVRGVYDIMDRLRADHPRLRIETCAGGGGRVDLGVLRRTDEAWTSDNTDAADRIAIQHGYGQLYPARTMAAWVTDSPHFLTGRDLPLRFRFHVAMAGVLGIGGDLLSWSAAEREEAAEFVALYKEIRPVVQHGVQYRLGDPPLTGVQYVADERVVVLAWRLPTSFGVSPVPLRPRALDPDARYRDDDTGIVHHGAVLLAHGLPLDLPGTGYASALVRLTRLP